MASISDIPSLGWLKPTPLTSLPEMAERLGIRYFGVKRDDQVDALRGGTKPRKLDYLLQTPRFADAPGWHSLGAIGSGHLVAMTEAARQLNKKLYAHCFWEPVAEGVLDNLAFIASGPATIRFYRSRLEVGFRKPGLLLSKQIGDCAVVPPGATTASSMIGIVRGAFELADQIREQDLPAPDRLYVALGTGGTAVGLQVGLALAGIQTTIHAVATVEPIFRTRIHLSRLAKRLLSCLKQHGIAPGTPLPLVVEPHQLGPGYGIATPASLAACEQLKGSDLLLEPIYTGKAMAAILSANLPRESNVMFWHTAHKGPLPHEADWQERLPEALAKRIRDS